MVNDHLTGRRLVGHEVSLECPNATPKLTREIGEVLTVRVSLIIFSKSMNFL